MSEDPRVLLASAEKLANGASGGFSFFGGKTDKWEKAAEAYTGAAALFRRDHNCRHYYLGLSNYQALTSSPQTCPLGRHSKQQRKSSRQSSTST
jgi:hypothetical protein